MRAVFIVPFSPSLPQLPDTQGRDRIIAAGRIGLSTGTTELLLLESDATAMSVLKANPDYIWVEDVP